MKAIRILASALACVSSLGVMASTDKTAPIEKQLHRHIAVMASDEFEGRAPGSPGEDKTVEYLVKEFAALGAKPGNKGSWFQEVPIRSVTVKPDAVLSLRGEGFSRDLSYGSEMVVSTQRQVDSVELKDSELVFVGYGIYAPEREWNDYAGLDVRGKTVVILVNDPGYATQDYELFNGNNMTYYGRWDYKYAEAARQGAAGAIIVHETAPAAYPWEVVENSWSGPQFGLQAANLNADKVAVEAWIPLAQAEELFRAAGQDYQALKAKAAMPGFRAVPLGGIQASTSLEISLADSNSRNVLALIPGSQYPEEVIVYTSHWDHLGKRETEDGVEIYNGAADNASGTAGLLALAEMFLAAEEAPERSILLLAVTAEESGLLGSKWYGQNPVYPLENTVANFNMDNIAGIGRTRDIAVVGFGNSELEFYLERAAQVQGREVVPEPFPERGYYYRSDHFSLARVGVPAMYLTTGTDSVEHGREWGEAQQKDYTTYRYHKPGDEYSPEWDLAGAAEEILLLYMMGTELGNNRDFPAWAEGVEFKAVRDAQRAK